MKLKEIKEKPIQTDMNGLFSSLPFISSTTFFIKSIVIFEFSSDFFKELFSIKLYIPENMKNKKKNLKLLDFLSFVIQESYKFLSRSSKLFFWSEATRLISLRTCNCLADS
jgi:hypothetical protein